MDDELRVELDRRLALIEDPGGADAPLPPLPWSDVVLAIAALALLSVLLVWWAL
jgi:hypothetical protein